MKSWEKLHRVLKEYKTLFKPSAISLLAFKWVYILATNRCFSSNWNEVCQMVPFADNINHENVDSDFDQIDEAGTSLGLKQEEVDEEMRLMNAEKSEVYETMKRDLLAMESRLRG
jgi:hypothetical protein